MGEQCACPFSLFKKNNMAKIELSSKYIGSSLDNFIVFQNNTYNRPLATFYVVLGQNPVGEIKIKDA